MKFKALLAIGVLCATAVPVFAQGTAGLPAEGVQSFQRDEDSWRRQNTSAKPVVSQSIIDSTSQTAIDNITGAEQVFCYQVQGKPSGYSGYTLDGMALTGFCGIVEKDLKDMIVQQFLATPENISADVERCVIQPRLLIRFVKGVGATDVLLSSPCHSFSIFYGGKVRTFNFKPASEIIDVMVDSFKGKTVDFTSPALLNQLLPIGVAQTAEQKEKVSQQKGPIRNWENETTAPAPQPKKQGGWNNLKF